MGITFNEISLSLLSEFPTTKNKIIYEKVYKEALQNIFH